VQAPIRQLHGYASLLSEESARQLDPGTRHTVSRIRDAAGRLGAVVEDLVELARLGREQVLRQPTDLRAIAEEVVSSQGAGAGAGRVRWEIGPLGTTECDAGLVKAALDELIANAIKFTRTQSEPRIRIERVAENGEAGIVVRDNGIGFDPASAHKLFGMFARLHRSEDPVGSGLGLALVRRVAEKHGGRAWAEGEPGRGAAFAFTVGSGWTGE
jgi:signal transduction histidine kinase